MRDRRIGRVLLRYDTLLCACAVTTLLFAGCVAEELPGDPTSSRNSGINLIAPTGGENALDTGGSSALPQDSMDNSSAVCTVDEFKQDAEADYLRKVDILFVMDNSGSMRDDWQRVANNVKNMVQQIPRDVDVRYAILLGHVGYWQGKLYSRPDFPKVLSTARMSVDDIGYALYKSFNEAMLIGDAGSGESTFNSLYYAVTTHLKRNQDLGFFRADAALSVVFMSDEHEIGSPFPEQQPAGLPIRCDAYWEDRIKARYYDPYGIDAESVYSVLKRAKGDMPLSTHAFVNITADDLFKNNSRTAKCLYDSLGYGYFDIVKKSGGVLYSLQADRAKGMEQIGEAVKRDLELVHDFKLSKPASQVDPVSIKAHVDGMLTQHKYTIETNTVHLDNAGQASSLIQIEHCEPNIIGGPIDPVDPVDPDPIDPVDPVDPVDPTDPQEPAVWTVQGLDGTTSTDAANIIWQTQGVPTKAKLMIGLTADNMDEVRNISEFKAVHYVTEAGLAPNTRYYFKVISEDANGKKVESNVISKKTKL